ncbi:PIR protein, putative [Plasmodium sp.]|nr:PIR protein, putative [Plasmodium sp.]
MKFNYTNILLFALPLNILLTLFHVYNKRNHKSTIPLSTPKIPTNRFLCECEFYARSNYDNDPQMKEVMEKFDQQTSQRFEEYEKRMKTTREKCKDQYDKEIQKIVLKDKLEKELMDKFATLQTDIQSDAIPTCVCEKSVAHKMEKFCLNCGVDVGGGVTLSSGVLGGIGEAALYAWKPKALELAIEAALNAGATKIAAAAEAAGIEAGKKLVIQLLELFHIDKLVSGICEKISSARHYNEVLNFVEIIIEKRETLCGATKSTLDTNTCKEIAYNLGTMLRNGNPNLPDRVAVPKVLNGFVAKAKTNANYEAANVSSKIAAEITKEKTSEIAATYASYEIAIIASIVAIVVIVLIMVIIYLILRYRRKKKMKKKLQYMKLLEE